ncbi:F-box/LRR-repeat protein 12 [Galendromus occidentalis]|uniref:F-box/LRR-repeat protein 12 n=1 Tax=Galendromus occidentalis TaxID=34638 RepID=A0AAJ7P983_9ACAR|nr:F-box/LRR-repeat protein 12 [Galendromus occidentalis]
MGAVCCSESTDAVSEVSFFHLGSRVQHRGSQTKISDLPDYMLLKIFSHLDFLDLCIAGLVCRRWYSLSRDYTLHKQVDLSSLELTPKQLELLLHVETMPSVEKLTVFGNHGCLWLKNISPRALAKISKRCPRLRCLKIENFSFRSSSKDKCVRLIDFPSTLEILSLRGSIIGRCAFFKMKPEHVTALDQLRVLDIGRCFFVADAEVKPFPRLPQLKELYLEGCPFIDTQQYLTDLLTKCSQLTLLDVEGTYIVDHAFTMIARHCNFLRYLFIGCTSLNDAVVLSLPEGSFANLASLCIIQTAVTDDGLAHLVQILPSLMNVRCDKRYLSETHRIIMKACVIVLLSVVSFALAAPKPEDIKKCFMDLKISDAGEAKFTEIMKPITMGEKPSTEVFKEKMAEAKKALEATDPGKSGPLEECLVKLSPNM